MVKTYDVPNDYIRVFFWNYDAEQRFVSMDIYLTA